MNHRAFMGTRAISIRGLHLVSILLLLSILICDGWTQVKPVVEIIGGDDVPVLKKKISERLQQVLLEINRTAYGTGDLNSLRGIMAEDAFAVLDRFVHVNSPYTARKLNKISMVSREGGRFYDIRSIAVRVRLGETEASDVQNLVFTFSAEGFIANVRALIPNLNYEALLSQRTTPFDSTCRVRILHFLEQFRMAYNSKDIEYLERIYSDEALIIVGTVLKEKHIPNDMQPRSLLSRDKIRLVQLSKQQYIAGLREKAFRDSSFLNVKFSDMKIVQHEKFPTLYGVSCWQLWTSSKYSDRGYLFLMVDFKEPEEPVVHVRAWQPAPFEDGTVVELYDFDVVEYKE